MRWFLLILFLVIVSAAAFFIGPAGFSFQDLKIPLEIRLPRIILAIFAGGLLSVVGASLQGLLQNPLVDPYTLGIASGSALGTSIVLLLFPVGSLLLPIGGFIGSFLTIIGVYNLAKIRGRITKTGLVLAGVMVSFLFFSLVMLILVLAKKPLVQIIYLLMGNLGLAFTKELIPLFVLSVILSILSLIILFGYYRELDILSTNEEVALSLGVDITRVTGVIFIFSSLLVGLVVSFCGIISFIGFAIPHIIRLIYGPNHLNLLPGSFLLGASGLLIADILARTLFPFELPVSVITALFGVPFFIYLLKKKV